MTSRHIFVNEVESNIDRSGSIGEMKKPSSVMLLADLAVTNLFLCALQ